MRGIKTEGIVVEGPFPLRNKQHLWWHKLVSVRPLDSDQIEISLTDSYRNKGLAYLVNLEVGKVKKKSQ